jgi:hypothetical protein
VVSPPANLQNAHRTAKIETVIGELRGALFSFFAAHLSEQKATKAMKVLVFFAVFR